MTRPTLDELMEEEVPGTMARMQIDRAIDDLVRIGVGAEREAIDAVCRTLMIQAAEDQATVRAVASALDKVRVAIRDRAKP